MGPVTTDLVEWLRAQLNDDEAAAEACLPLHLRVGRFRGKEVPRWRITKSGNGIIDEDGGTLRAQQIFPAEAEHVIRHDPARVLREIEAKRQIVEQHRPVGYGDVCLSYCHTRTPSQPQTWPCLTLRLLAAPYADRPGYRESWRP